MNTTRLANWSEIVSSLAILATLAFLVVETRQNTAAIHASTRQAAAEADVQYLLSMLENPHAQLTWTKADLTDEEVLLYFHSLTSFIRMREADWAQYRSGATDRATWERYASSIPSVFTYPRNRTWWRRVGQSGFDPAFVEEVNALIEATPVAQLDIAGNIRLLLQEP